MASAWPMGGISKTVLAYVPYPRACMRHQPLSWREWPRLPALTHYFIARYHAIPQILPAFHHWFLHLFGTAILSLHANFPSKGYTSCPARTKTIVLCGLFYSKKITLLIFVVKICALPPPSISFIYANSLPCQSACGAHGIIAWTKARRVRYFNHTHGGAHGDRKSPHPN